MSNLVSVPQLRRILIDKAVKDVSVGTILLATSTQAIWIVYGYAINDTYLWAASVPALIINVLLLRTYLKYRS